METVETIIVHQFGSGLLVEIIGTGDHGDVATETIEFDLVESENSEVTPRDEISAPYEEEVCTALSEKGYSIVENIVDE